MNNVLYYVQEVIFGIVIVIPFTCLMSYLMVHFTNPKKYKNPYQMQNKVMLLNLNKMLLSFLILLGASFRNIYFLFGALIGLLLGSLIYFILLRKNSQNPK